MKLTKLILATSIIALLGVGCAKTAVNNSNVKNTPAVGTSRSVPAAAEMTVTIDPKTGEFVPVTAFVKAGTKVTFKNTSDKPHWVASDPHPTHTDLPGFDSKAAIAPGDSYTYTFDKVGRWLYHDHLNPTFGGAIVVGE